MTTEKLNGTVYEVHSFVVALPCGHNDTLELRFPIHTPDKEDYIADCIAATEAGKNAAMPICRRCFEARPQGIDVSSGGAYIIGGQRVTIRQGYVITGGHFVPTPPPDPDVWQARKKALDQIYADFLASKGRP